MSVEENIKLVNRGDKAIKDRDFKTIESLYAEDAIAIMSGSPEPIKGNKMIAEISRQYLESFPDSHIENELEIGQDSWVCVAGTWNGTNTGPLTMPDGTSIAATNKRVKIPMCTLFNVKDGKIIEQRDYFDMMTFMDQLGLSKP